MRKGHQYEGREHWKVRENGSETRRECNDMKLVNSEAQRKRVVRSEEVSIQNSAENSMLREEESCKTSEAKGKMKKREQQA